MGDQIKQTIVVQKAKQILNERGRSAFDIEATGLGVRKGSAGGPIMINMIRPFEIAIGTDMSGSISKLLHEKACLNSHLIAGSALAVTPIAPIELMEGNQSQLEMACKVNQHLQNDSSVLFSFNGIGYDAIILRHFFFENLLDPYLLSYEDRLHIDLLCVSHAARDFSNKINFLINKKGKKSLRQIDIAIANDIDPGKAHTAIDDVDTLLQIARLYEDQIPEIFYTSVICGNKKRVLSRLGDEEFFCFSNPWNSKALSFIIRNDFQGMDNEAYFFNLDFDPQEYLNISVKDILKLIKKPRSPFVRIGLNKNPILLSGPKFSDQININPIEASNRAGMIVSNKLFLENFKQALHIRGNPYSNNEFEHFPEMAIYNGFPSNEDRAIIPNFRDANYQEKVEVMNHLKDYRLKDFAQRLLAIEHPGQCSKSISHQYRHFSKTRLLTHNHLVPNLTIKGAMDQLDYSIAKGFDDESRINEIKEYLEVRRMQTQSL